MKKTLLLTMALGVVAASDTMAQSDVYVTGSTAFRKQVFSACQKLFQTGFQTFTGTPTTGGDTATGSGAAQWTMTGTPITALTNVSSPLTIHGLFTGSVQGCQTVENRVKLLFLNSTGSQGVSNTPTIAFSDVSSVSTPYPATGNFSEEPVAVQPFVMCHSVPLTTISNVSNEQLKYAIQIGRIPLSAWDNLTADHANFVYLLNRTQDSGTRRTAFAMENDAFITAQTVYNFDPTNHGFYKATNVLQATSGGTSNGVSYGLIGPAGNGGANLNWGSGYVGGGDIKTALAYGASTGNSANTSIAYLSLADAQGVTGVNWALVMSFNGLWPTTAGAGITAGTTTTNDFSPVCLGYYPFWATEVVVFPNVDPSSLSSDQNMSATQLGDQSTPGTFLGVLDYQTKFSSPGGATLVGSLENEIQSSKTISPGATAIRLSDMTSSRGAVGGTIAP